MELRLWTTDYRGLLWVHSGLKGDLELERAFSFAELFKGGYIGSAFLSGVIPLDQEDWEFYRSKHLDSSYYHPGYYGWFLESPYRFTMPIPGPGKLGLYYPPTELEELLKKANKLKTNTP